MALADTGKAIGKVTQLLVERLFNKTQLLAGEGRPEPPSNGDADRRLNLFLYEATFDPSLKNVPLDEGQPPPLWLVLKYLLTAFDNDGKSDTVAAHENLGIGIRALQESNFLSLADVMDADILKALSDNPEPLKITFDEVTSDLLSKLMQGSEEKYRFSLGFQVRPVMIATGEPPSYSLLVGVDYTRSPADPAHIIGEKGIHIPVIPSLGPVITQVIPAKFEVGATLTILGTDLHLSGLSVALGAAELAVTMQQPNQLQCLVDGTIPNGGVISAGSHALCVVQTLSTGRRRSSNLLVGDLLPILTGAVPNSLARTATTINGAAVNVITGNIDLTGTLLGTSADDIFLALYKDGKIVKVFDQLVPTPSLPPAPLPQTQMRLTIVVDDKVLPGAYRVILRVNGQQAQNSPEVQLIA